LRYWKAIALLAAAQASTSLLEQGQRAFRSRDWPKAEQLFQDAVRSRPASAPAYKWLGMTYVAQEKYALAEAPLRRACEIDAKEPEACYYWGRALFTLSRFEAALAAFDKDAKPWRGKTLLGMALALEALNRDAEAEKFYRDAIRAGDKNAPVDYEKFRRKQAPPGVASPEIRFEPRDLPVTVRNGAAGAKRLLETMIAGTAVLDFDGDGWPDIYICNGAGAPNALLRNNRDGTFTDVAARAGVEARGFSMGVAAADFDNDGWVDLFVTGVRANHLFHNRGDGTFEELSFPQDGKWAVAAAWFDYDNDGLLDLFVVHYVDWDETREIYCGTAEYRQYCHPKEYRPLANALYRNLGGGKFRDVSAESGIGAHLGKGMGVAIGDYDGDGRLDIFVANDTVPNFLFRNRGDGTFEESAVRAGVAFNENGVAVSSMGAEFRDYDNDGREDLFVTALSNETFTLFRNTGKGTFEDVTLASGIAKATMPWTGWSNVMADFNNDGWKDLFTANGHVMDNAELSSGRTSKQPNLVLTNGRRSFSARTLPGAAFHRGLAWGDFDRDGRVDLVVTRLNEPAQVLWNRTEGAGNWIAFDLQGSKSNRDAIGALVEVETAEGKQWDRVAGWSGYGCSSSRRLHFGLGRATRAAVRVRWPSGSVTELPDVQAGREVQVREQSRAENPSGKR
jgi:tetratricopeptide (TPR) repeat protein